MGRGKSTSKLKPHALAELAPEMNDADYQALKADIAHHGRLLEPIVLLDGKILDGRHRNRACIELNITPTTEDFNARKHGKDPADFVLSKAVHRNNNDSQKACFAANLIDHFKGRWGGNRKGDQDPTNRALKGNSCELAALRVGVSRAYVEFAVELKKKAPAMFSECFGGRLKITAARNQLRHKQNHRQIDRLKSLAGASIDNCDLREGDNVAVMESMPRMSINTIVADPPYNNGWHYRNDPFKDRLKDDAYLTLCFKWMQECARLLVMGGSLFVVIDDNYSDHFGVLLRKTGLTRRRTIVWWETFGSYVSAETKLSPACRFIHHFCKGEDPFFNTVELRDESARQKIDDPRANANGKIPDNVWPASRIQGTNSERVPFQAKGDAPQLPIAIPQRCILLTTKPGDTVLDPFNGHGITGIAALRNGRKYIGIDRDSKGLEQSRKWIASQLAKKD